MLADPAGGYACATRSSSNPEGTGGTKAPPSKIRPRIFGTILTTGLARPIDRSASTPSRGSNVASPPNRTFICAVLFDLGLFSFICAICVDLDRPRLFAALVI